MKVSISYRRDMNITEEWENVVVERKSSYGTPTVNLGSDTKQVG
jgi:hypothetical protein